MYAIVKEDILVFRPTMTFANVTNERKVLDVCNTIKNYVNEGPLLKVTDMKRTIGCFYNILDILEYNVNSVMTKLNILKKEKIKVRRHELSALLLKDAGCEHTYHLYEESPPMDVFDPNPWSYHYDCLPRMADTNYEDDTYSEP